jgi:hypothetical protein
MEKQRCGRPGSFPRASNKGSIRRMSRSSSSSRGTGTVRTWVDRRLRSFWRRVARSATMRNRRRGFLTTETASRHLRRASLERFLGDRSNFSCRACATFGRWRWMRMGRGGRMGLVALMRLGFGAGCVRWRC